MKVVILAAGRGLRLGDKEHPKPLVPLIDGQSILEHQLANLEAHVSLEDIYVVVGYKKELFLEALPHLAFIYSPNYAQENTSKSLLRAIKKIHEDLLWLNGDVVFHSSVLEKLLSQKKNSMVVNAHNDVDEEEVKYTTDSQGKILKVSKTVAQGQGEALGINYYTAESLPLLQKQLEGCSSTDYFEKAIEKTIEEGLDVWPCIIEENLCTEIDFPIDLDHANTLIKSWNKEFKCKLQIPSSTT